MPQGYKPSNSEPTARIYEGNMTYVPIDYYASPAAMIDVIVRKCDPCTMLQSLDNFKKRNSHNENVKAISERNVNGRKVYVLHEKGKNHMKVANFFSVPGHSVNVWATPVDYDKASFGQLQAEVDKVLTQIAAVRD